MTTDRRKFNFNLMVTVILLFLFTIILYNQRLILSMNSHIEDLNNKIDQYFGPINNVELPEWEERVRP
jgi:cell division protein FtsL